jgi:hypothetical protein
MFDWNGGDGSVDRRRELGGGGACDYRRQLGYPIAYLLAGKRGSAIPVLGGFCGALACLILPTGGTRWFWWLPLVVDVGCLGGLIAAVPVAIIRRLRR